MYRGVLVWVVGVFVALQAVIMPQTTGDGGVVQLSLWPRRVPHDFRGLPWVVMAKWTVGLPWAENIAEVDQLHGC